ncbi:hypothetical protein M501DRAFT_993856 [Patellaria atrata CBS 101060]|uniref:Uncharacterized protein n=1 Tax=Patellaria atrata CBS 101060 TaxID=1346257 RepID=A0A9P4SIS0_9PEZI|nr:hypothetical protein M501DRAFT_993856 [Patellaria atrata CBS 101060]
MPSQVAHKAPSAPNSSYASKATSAASTYTPSAYEVMATRIANRVAEMAENITFVERQPSTPPQSAQINPVSGKRKPRKLEVRLPASQSDVSFSAPFLDNTLSKMLELQNKMLKVGAELAKAEDVSDEVKKEQFAQSAELSKIIALICAEKARQGA